MTWGWGPLGMFLLGYGLVAVPQHLWRAAEVEGALRMLRHRAADQATTAINARTYFLTLPEALFRSLLVVSFVRRLLESHASRS